MLNCRQPTDIVQVVGVDPKDLNRQYLSLFLKRTIRFTAKLLASNTCVRYTISTHPFTSTPTPIMSQRIALKCSVQCQDSKPPGESLPPFLAILEASVSG